MHDLVIPVLNVHGYKIRPRLLHGVHQQGREPGEPGQ